MLSPSGPWIFRPSNSLGCENGEVRAASTAPQRGERVSRKAPRRLVTRITVGAAPTSRSDVLAGEEPLEIRVGGRSLAVTMRTPGADFDLAAGFLVSEGVVTRREELVSMRYCAGANDDDGNRYNILDLALGRDVAPPDDSVARAFFTTSSCGLCGKASIDAVRTRSAFDVRDDPVRVSPEWLASLPARLRASQELFEQTGGLHAAALFDVESHEVLAVREDVGRHNAVDKVIGWALREGRLPLRGTVLLVSGRASFELVQKAIMAGVAVLCSVSAPSSLAVDLAQDAGLTLVGFLRDPTMVLYAHPQRVLASPSN